MAMELVLDQSAKVPLLIIINRLICYMVIHYSTAQVPPLTIGNRMAMLQGIMPPAMATGDRWHDIVTQLINYVVLGNHGFSKLSLKEDGNIFYFWHPIEVQWIVVCKCEFKAGRERNSSTMSLLYLNI